MELIRQIREEIKEIKTSIVSNDDYNKKNINAFDYYQQAFCQFDSIKQRVNSACSNIEAKIINLEKNLDEVLKENQSLNEKLTKIDLKAKKGLIHDIHKSYKEEQNSDFTIKIDEKVFKVHKFMLAARSSVLAEMIQSNNEATQLDLVDISEATFKMILDFIYVEKIPEENSNFKEIFMASGRLNLTDLKEFAGEKIEVVDENALEIFTLANKYNHEELKLKCFKNIQKMFPNHQLKPELINQPDMVKQFIIEKKSIDEMMTKFKQKYEI